MKLFALLLVLGALPCLMACSGQPSSESGATASSEPASPASSGQAPAAPACA